MYYLHDFSFALCKSKLGKAAFWFAAKGESESREVKDTDGWKGSRRAGEGEVRGQDLGVRGVRVQVSGQGSGGKV